MIFEYINKIGNTRICDIDITRHSDFTVVLCSQRSDNPSAYVSDDADRIATQVCDQHGIDPTTLVWIEHFAEKIIPEANYESWDIVLFRDFGYEPRIKTWLLDIERCPFVWAMISREEAQAIIAGQRPPAEFKHIHTEPTGPALY